MPATTENFARMSIYYEMHLYDNRYDFPFSPPPANFRAEIVGNWPGQVIVCNYRCPSSRARVFAILETLARGRRRSEAETVSVDLTCGSSDLELEDVERLL